MRNASSPLIAWLPDTSAQRGGGALAPAVLPAGDETQTWQKNDRLSHSRIGNEHRLLLTSFALVITKDSLI